jgi:DNA-3-methyladenine glycosylase II
MELIGSLEPLPPYDFGLTLALLSRYAYPTVDTVHDGAYWRVLPASDGLALARVENRGTAQAPRLEAYLAAGSIHPAERDQLLARLGHILGAELDSRPFFAYARSDTQLWAIVGPLAGLRWLRTPSTFEALMTTIIEQQISWVGAQRAQRWLVEWGGRRLTCNGQTHYAFPTPEQIAAASEAELTPLKITFKRMRVMIDIAGQVAAGTLDLEELRQRSPEEAYRALVALRGVGHWTASWTIQRAQGHHNYVGHNDVALQAAVNHYFYGGQGRIPAQQVIDTFARYGAYAGLAAHYTILRWVLDRYDSSGAMPQT